jgi:hypothetical protein
MNPRIPMPRTCARAVVLQALASHYRRIATLTLGTRSFGLFASR